VEQLEAEMSFREFLEWMTFLRIEQGEGKPKDDWGAFKTGMMQHVGHQRGKR
jgi:hypothetical protein